jgi:archaellum biogenesis ATPase FlaH
MSEGLRAITAALGAASIRPLIESPDEVFLENELPVVQFVRQHFRRHRVMPDHTTVQTECGVRLPQAPEPLQFYVDRLSERYQYNIIRDRFGAMRDALATRDMPVITEAVAEMHRAGRLTQRQGRELANLREASDQMFARLRETQGYGGITGIETDWARYDQITGGYQNGDLITMVGRPGTGKTYVALKQAKAAHDAGYSVLVVTTEMPTEQLLRRHASIALGINPHYLKTNTLSTYTMRRMEAFYQAHAAVDGFNIFSVGMKSNTSAVEAMMQELMPDFIVVDGLYLLKPSSAKGNMSRTERITLVLDEIKGLTLDANRPILATTQFSRGAGKAGADGSLENIGYTDAIGTHSSAVVAIKYGPTTDPKVSRWLEFLKGRDGEDGRVAINFKFAPTNLNEIPYEELSAMTGEGGGGTTAPGEQAANVDWMSQ